MLLDVFGETPDLTDDFETHVVLVQLGRLGLEIVDEVFHQRIHSRLLGRFQFSAEKA